MLFDNEGALWQVPASAIVGFAVLLLLLRISGKRTVAKFNMYDLILTFTVGSILSSFIVLESVQFVDALLGLASVIAVDYVISWAVMRSDRVRSWVKANPTLLVFNGDMQRANMRKERIVEDEVLMFMRQKGIDRISRVKAMILEPAGDISVFTTDEDEDEDEDHDMSKSLRRSGVNIPKSGSDA
ncbi:DUF421 domain-containing protein [Salipiger sp. IMCC34102]|uniref:DUF421 domain-containing protein n=1 Tax=Salipiger sp. IMCC34102 TaxID=2510647 RepID=UPI00101BC733|nr:YetF domain-containing protein [Salipiger sp. IMCC34102]RYH01351.1 DUF421 domain-containing protein [Salipiger sp. IMCC34102]